MHRHFTATAFVVDSKSRVLLLWHKRLERWMPPGGHVEQDEAPEDTARRECKEETGLDVEIVGSSQPNLFDKCPEEGHMLKKPIAMLLENIPASSERGEEAHQHMDFLFLARLIHEDQTMILAEEEGRELRWFTHSEIVAMDTKRDIFGNVQAYILDLLAP